MSDHVAGESMSRLSALVAEAARRAREVGQPVLASLVESIPTIDPLGALLAVDGDAELRRLLATTPSNTRMFWANPASGLGMAALGAAARIEPSGRDRFERADESWRRLLQHALIDNRGGAMPATGPLLIGGFSFEPNAPRSRTWRDFPAAGLFVPAVLVTTVAGRSCLTSSVVVAPDGTASIELALVARLRLAALECAALHLARERGDSAELAFADLRPAVDWLMLVRDAVTAIGEAKLEKVVLARAIETEAAHPIDPIAVLEHLRRTHRDAYVFGCWRGDGVFVGASPERLVRLVGRDVDASSLAGSARRGDSPAEDDALARALLDSTKDRNEHAMVRRALVDALSAMCDGVQANTEPSLLTLPQVHHLHTAVHARLRRGYSLLDLVGALHPTPAVGGTPRQSALAFIREFEGLDRGWYAAPIGWVGRDAGELAVGLRSALIRGATATLFAGCGIVVGSDPEQELAEAQVKLRPMQLALAAGVPSADDRPVASGVHADEAGNP